MASISAQVTVFTPTDVSEPITRTAGTAVTTARTATAITDVLLPWQSAGVTRTAVTATSTARTGYVKTFLLLDTRRPNNSSGLVRTKTTATGSLHLNPLLMAGAVQGGTSVTGSRIGFLVSLSGSVATNTAVTGSLVALPGNDNFVDRKRIYDGARIFSNNSGATEQYSFPNDEQPGGNRRSLWYAWYPPDNLGGSGNVVFTASSSTFQPQVRVYMATTAASYSLDPPSRTINTDTFGFLFFPYYGSNYVDSDGVRHSWANFPWSGGSSGLNQYLYVNVSAHSSTPGGGDFWLDYTPGRAPDGTAYHSTTIEPVHLRMRTDLISRPSLPGPGFYGYVDLGVLAPGELGNPDVPAEVQSSSSVSADMTVDSARIVGWRSGTTLALQEEALDAATVASAAGTGTTNRSTPRTTPRAGAASDVETLSTLTPYYV